MVRFIAAIDARQGIADEQGIPWQGRIPGDVKYYRSKIESGGRILMGFGFYKELSKPYPTGINYVASDVDTDLKEGFELVKDAREFIKESKGNMWILGGAGLYASTINLADELYLTQLEQTFHCTKFFPQFKDKFVLKSESESHTENGITYRFQVWVRK